MNYSALTTVQIEHFIHNGYVILREAFPREVASQWVDRRFRRLGYDRQNPATWKTPRIHMPSTMSVDTAEFVPGVWAAVCDLLGGEERVRRPYEWCDGFIFNFSDRAALPWQEPSAQAPGWHKDGDFFRHFLDSPEQGLLTIVCWTNVLHQGGATFIAPDSVGVVARFLAQHPEGVHPLDPAWGSLISQCGQFVELTGQAGDVVLHHPYMLHAGSQNLLSVERAITNPPVMLREPMNLNRASQADFSPVERGVLRGLGIERYDFQPSAPRQKIVPERVRQGQKMLEEEKVRLASSPA